MTCVRKTAFAFMDSRWQVDKSSQIHNAIRIEILLLHLYSAFAFVIPYQIKQSVFAYIVPVFIYL